MQEELEIINNLKRIMPKEGSIDSIIDRLNEYINPVDSNWIKNIKPASFEDIKKLEKLCSLNLVNLKIPQIYLVYLKYMGESDGELLSKVLRGYRDIKEIITIYEDIQYDIDNHNLFYDEEDEFAENPYKLYIATTELQTEIYFKFNRDGSYIIVADCNTPPISNDFEKLLFIGAYKKYEEKYYKNKVKFITTPNNYQNTLKNLGVQDIFILLDGFLLKNKFNKVWFSDNYTFIAYREDISFILYKKHTLRGRIYGNNKIELIEIAKKLCEILNLEILD